MEIMVFCEITNFEALVFHCLLIAAYPNVTINHFFVPSLKVCDRASFWNTKSSSKGKCYKVLSDYVEHNSVFTRFEVGQSWAILSPIEQSIKRKIEAVGKPLKDWDVKIYRGILTGCNEAFIIDGTKKDELIAKDPKSAEIIRPILRGKDIKRYGYDFHDKWLITTHNGLKEKNIPPVDVTKYPSIKAHLDQFYPQLAKRQDKGDTPYNLRNCAYMEDFNKQKIIYPDIMRMPRSVDSLTKYPYFYFDKEGYFVEATNFMMNGNDINVIYSFINSDLGFYIFSKFL